MSLILLFVFYMSYVIFVPVFLHYHFLLCKIGAFCMPIYFYCCFFYYIFLVFSLGITINILNDCKPVRININLIYYLEYTQTLLFYIAPSIHSPILCHIVVKITSLYILSPSAQFHKCCCTQLCTQLSSKSNRIRK